MAYLPQRLPNIRKLLGKIFLGMGLFLLILGWGYQRGWVEKVLALSETTHVLPTDTAFNDSGYDDNSGLISVGGSEVTLAKDSNWWDLNWRYKIPLTIRNLGSSEVNTNTTTSVQVNLTTLGLGTTKLQDDLDDLRVVYATGATHTEVARSVNQAIGATNIATITFPLSANIGAGGSSSSYALYYGSVGASTPSSSGYSIGNKTATLVCPFNGSTTCIDGETPTTETGAIRYSGQKSALSFDGKNDYVSVGDIGSGIKTVEFWVYPRSTTNYFIDLNGTASVSVSAGTVAATGFDNPTIYVDGTATTSLSANSWQHVAVVTDSGISASAVYVGKIGSDYMSGYIDELRVSDTVRYSVGFTAPVVAFTPDANTKLLLHFDENGDDPRNSGKAIDASGNGNHGTITGAKYVSGLVGVDAGSSDTGILSWQPYASHTGIFIEEGTTNLIPNPSFENATYNLSWGFPYLNLGAGTTSFTAAMAKRNSAAPFAAGVMVQGSLGTGTTGDILSVSQGTQMHGKFYSNLDQYQGSVVFWVTPEWNGDDGKRHDFFGRDENTSHQPRIYKDTDGYLKLYALRNQSVLSVDISSWQAGVSYLVVARWNEHNTLDSTNFASISIGDSHTYGITVSNQNNTGAMVTAYIGGLNSTGHYPANALIEGLTVYRRPLWDGEYGVNVGNGDEIASIYNSGSGQDPTLVTGSWDVVFALPTNASTGSLGVGGTGQAWSHPHSSNALYTSTTNTGGFMMSGTAPTDGWGEESSLFNYADVGVTFSSGLAKRNGANVGTTAPFSAGVMVQGNIGSTEFGDDLIEISSGAYVVDSFRERFDRHQGSVVFWITPEWDGDDGLRHQIFDSASYNVNSMYKDTDNKLHWSFGWLQEVSVDVSSWEAGNTYLVTARWDSHTPLDGTNYMAMSIGDSHTFAWNSAPATFMQVTSLNMRLGSGTNNESADALIEGFTIYRRPLWDGEYGVNVGNGDEIAQIYNSGTGQDPTLITGSWDVVLCLPTNSSIGALGTGTTGDAWSHPHTSNVLYGVGTTRTGGFMLGSSYTVDGWRALDGSQTLTLQPDGVSGKDTSLIITSPDNGYGDDDELLMTTTMGDKALIQFDLSSIPDSATVESAMVYFTVTSLKTSDRSGTLHSLLAANGGWEEGTSTSPGDGATYNYKHQPDTTAWAGGAGLTVAGTDYNSEALGTLNYTANDPVGTVLSANLDVDQVQNWVGESNENYGVLILSGGTRLPNFASSDHTTAEYRPKLVVDYSASLSSVLALDDTEKVYSGGYKWTSTVENQGIGYTLTGLTAGQNYVVRALAHSDGTSIPKIQIWDTINDAEITQMTGTVGSGRTAPDVFTFTFELPTTARYGSVADCTAIEVRLLNTQASGTVYWHQVELLENLVDNPSIEIGSSATGPWVPAGWTLDSELVSADQAYQIDNDCNAGKCIRVAYSGTYTWIAVDYGNIFGLSSGGYYSTGFWRSSNFSMPHCYNHSEEANQRNSSAPATVNGDTKLVGEVIRMLQGNRNTHVRSSGSSVNFIFDDFFFFALNPVTLTVIPASEANSTESSGLRVDGADTLTEVPDTLTTTAGTVKFKFTPRHSFDKADLFGVSNPVIAQAYYDGANYIKLHRQDDSTLQVVGVFDGSTVAVGYTNPTLDANTTYEIAIDYTAGGNLNLYIDNTNVGSTSGVVAFANTPNIIYYGTDNGGANSNPYDGTYSAPDNNYSIAALDTSEKIFPGGYKWSNEAVNQGIGYTLSSLTAGANYVVRAVAHSDGTSIPKVQIWDSTNDAEITSLTGTVGSGRTAPDILLFTFELPTTARNGTASDCTSIEVRLLNTQNSGTVYFHQIELLPNLIDNPSLETGSTATGSWIPDGWSNGALEAGDAVQTTSEVHSGSSAVKFTETATTTSESVWTSETSNITTGKFVSTGGFIYSPEGGSYCWGNGDENTAQHQAYNSYTNRLVLCTAATSWDHVLGVFRQTDPAEETRQEFRVNHFGNDRTARVDDAYMFQLLDVGITATAATQANSSETTGLRVDGMDVLSQSIGSSIANSRGVIKFELTPRHNFDIGASFGTTAPVVFEAYGDSDDYLKMTKVGGTMVTTISLAGTTAVANWSSPTLNAGTSYPLTISYETGGILAIDSNGSRVASANIGTGVSFATVPATIYFGSDNTGANQYDATFNNFQALTPSENTSAPYYKFGSKSVKMTHTSGSHADEYTTSISIGNTATHTLSAFVYDGTTGNIGGTVDNTIAQLSVGSTGIGTTYTDQGGGWWRLTGTVTGTGDTRSYGVQVKAGKTIYVDGVQLEQKSYSTTFADGSLGVGYSWASAENNSSSTRVGGNLQYSTDEIPTAEGTVSLWLKREHNSMVNGGWGVRSRYFSTNEDDDASNSLNISNHGGILHCGRNWDGGIELGAMPEIGDWHQVTVTWDNTAVKCYLDGVYKGEQSPVDISVEAVKVGWGQNWGYEPRSDGPVSDLRVYSSALTDAEVGDLYNAGLVNHENGAENTERYPASGTYTSPIIDFGAIAAWGETALSATETLLGGAVSYFTRSSSDNVSWSEWVASVGGTIASSASRYFQWKADLSPSEGRVEAPTISNMTISYVEDNTPPTNPSETATGYSSGVGTTELTSNTWYNYTTPYFAWEEGSDPAAEGQTAAGVSSYHVLLTTDVGATPANNSDSVCYSETAADSRSIQVGSGDLSSCSLSNGIYYFRLQTEDASGNVASPVTLFTYKFDSSNPNAPASVSSTTVGYSATNDFTFYWPAATDNAGAGISGYEYKTGASSGAFADWQFTAETTIDGVEAYTEGQNFFYVRSIDNAGNVSATTSNLGVALFYYNASAPTKPLNVTITPATTEDNQADENVFTVSWDKPSSYSGEIAKYYYCVNCTPSISTMTETTAAEAVNRALTSVSLATQQGKNTFYIVAEDNNINLETGRGNANFEAYESVDFYALTVAPEAPSNLTVSDTSDRDSSKWRLTLAWDVGSTALATPDHYEVYRSTDNATFSSIGEVSATAYTDTNLTQSTTYYYKVKAVDNAGASSLFTSTVSLAPEGRYTSPPTAGGTPTVTEGSTTATIAWASSRAAFGTVEYGETSSYGASASEASASASHSIKVTGLQPGKTYHYRVMNLDDSSLVGYERSEAYSSDYSFTTLSAAEISDVTIDEVTLDSAVVSWKTRTMSSSIVDYGLTTEYGESVTVSTTSDENSHTARLIGLTHSSTYHFRILGKTVDGDNIYSQDYSFQTITFPKVTAYVLKTDQSAGGTIISVAWSSNVPTTSVVEYQAAVISGMTNRPITNNQTNSNDQLSNYSIEELMKMNQEELAKVPISLKGEAMQVARAELSKTHVMRLEGLEDVAMYVIRLKGRDKYGNEAVSEAVRYVTGADTRPPKISNVSVESQMSGSGEASSAQLIVSWETDEEATTQVVYGQGTGSDYPLSTPEDTGLTKRHTVVIRDLAHTSSYHLKIVSKDKTGNVAESGDLIAVTPALQESALDVVLKNLEDVFGFLRM